MTGSSESASNPIATISYTEDYDIVRDGLADLALPLELEWRLRAAISYGEGYDPDRAGLIAEEINAAITAKLRKYGVTDSGEWLGEWSAADIVVGALDQYGA